MELLILWLLFAIASALVAGAKGRSGFGWFLLGLLFGIFALIIVACLPSLRVQEFEMANPDGTVTMIRSVPRKGTPHGPQKDDWKGFLLTLLIVFGAVAVIAAIAQAIGG